MSFLSLYYLIEVFCTMKYAISKMIELTHDQLALFNNLKTLLDFGSGYSNKDGFTIDNVNQ